MSKAQKAKNRTTQKAKIRTTQKPKNSAGHGAVAWLDAKGNPMFHLQSGVCPGINKKEMKLVYPVIGKISEGFPALHDKITLMHLRRDFSPVCSHWENGYEGFVRIMDSLQRPVGV